MHLYAIVSFPEENNSTGIIPTNWMNFDQTNCYYPNPEKTTETKKNKLVEERAEPDSSENWIKCPITVFDLYETCDDAVQNLSEAENVSHWGSSEVETEQVNETSDEEESQSLIQALPKISYPVPPSSDSNILRKLPSKNKKKKGFSFSPKCTSTQKMDYRLPVHHSPPVHKKARVDSPQSPQNIYEQVSSVKGPVAKRVEISGSEIHLDNNEKYIMEEIKNLKTNQEVILQQQQDVNAGMLRLESKINSLLTAIESKETDKAAATPSWEELLKIIPVGPEAVEDFEEKVSASSTVRNQLKQLMLSCPGRDCRGLAASCLRKVYTDEAALRYSLTGRNKMGVFKVAFERTHMYMIIKGVCSVTFKDMKENVFRDAVSDWFMQAKFRIARRDKRNSDRGTSNLN